MSYPHESCYAFSCFAGKMECVGERVENIKSGEVIVNFDLTTKEGLSSLLSYYEEKGLGGKDIFEIRNKIFFEGDQIDKALDSLSDFSEENIDICHKLGDFLAFLIPYFRYNLSALRGRIEKLYYVQCEQQKKNGSPRHKGRDLYNWGLTLYLEGQKEAGVRLITLALIEDIYHNGLNWATRSNAYRFLAANIYNENTVKLVAEEIKKRIKVIKGQKEVFFPEEILNHCDHLTIIPFPISHYFVLNPIQYTCLLKSLLADTKNDGRSLEELVKHLFGSIVGLYFIKKRLPTNSSEFDLIYQILDENHPLKDAFGRYLLIECKNWKKRVGSAEIRDLLAKLLSLDVEGGVLIARNGITGTDSNGRKNAELELVKAYHRHHIVVAVLTMSELKAISNGENLIRLLLKKYDKVRFDLKSTEDC